MKAILGNDKQAKENIFDGVGINKDINNVGFRLVVKEGMTFMGKEARDANVMNINDVT